MKNVSYETTATVERRLRSSADVRAALEWEGHLDGADLSGAILTGIDLAGAAIWCEPAWGWPICAWPI
jgi:hypothetical protein